LEKIDAAKLNRIAKRRRKGASLRLHKNNKNNTKWERTIGRVLPIHERIA
jgi:hypothetical protein